MAVYFLAEIRRILDPELYQRYVEVVPPIIKKHGGSYLLRSDNVSALFGEPSPERILLIRFPDRQALDSCFQSEAYAQIAPLREKSTESRALVIEDDE